MCVLQRLDPFLWCRGAGLPELAGLRRQAAYGESELDLLPVLRQLLAERLDDVEMWFANDEDLVAMTEQVVQRFQAGRQDTR